MGLKVANDEDVGSWSQHFGPPRGLISLWGPVTVTEEKDSFIGADRLKSMMHILITDSFEMV